jgi:hypothetical protein
MPATTTLLLLLDSVLSQDNERIREARTRLRQLVSNAKGGAPLAPLDANFSLLDEVDMLLSYFPNVASVASTHDGSYPLHFAASIGQVKLATRIFNQVSSVGLVWPVVSQGSAPHLILVCMHLFIYFCNQFHCSIHLPQQRPIRKARYHCIMLPEREELIWSHISSTPHP